MMEELVDTENTTDGVITFLKASSWLASSFHNTWLVSTPDPKDQ